MTQEQLKELTAAAKREYHKQWRETHKAEKKASNERYWEKRTLNAIKLDNERRAADKQESSEAKH